MKEMKNNIKVSVIIPVYNVELYLRECIDSVLSQTLKDIEVICVDDGSTDKSLEILKEYEQKDSRVIILTHENKYAGVARNNGIKVARGKYLVFLDSDDFFEPELLETQYNQCEKHGADIGLCAADQYNQATGKFIATSWFLPERYTTIQPFNRDTWPEKIFQASTLAPWNKMFSADFVRKHSLEFQALPRANDVYFTMVSLALAEKIVSVNKVLVHYRVGMTGNLQAANQKTPLAFCDALYAVKQRLDAEGIFDKVRISFASNAISQVLYNLNKLKDSSAYDILMDSLLDKYLDEFAITQGINEGVLDKQFSKDLMAKVEDARCPVLKYPENTEIPTQKNPCISVIIPVYNVENYLKECLDSIINQTLRQIEIICIDDGSTDSSPSILDEYAKQDERIRVIHQKNQGLSTSRNNGFKIATGEFVYMIDSDDYLELDALEKMYNLCKANRLDILFFDLVSFYDETGDIYPSKLKRESCPNVYDGVSFLAYQRSKRAHITSACLIMLSRSFIEEHNFQFYPGIIHEDELFCFQILMEARRVTFVNWKFYHRRIRANSITTTTKSARNAIGYFISMQEMLRYGLKANWSKEKEEQIMRSFNGMKFSTKQIYDQISDEEKKKLVFDNAFSRMIFEKLVMDVPAKPAAPIIVEKTPATAPAPAPEQSKAPERSPAEQMLTLRVKMLEAEINNILSSATYKSGRIITWLPRKIRGFINCLKEHGFLYTCERLLVHIGLRKDPYKEYTANSVPKSKTKTKKQKKHDTKAKEPTKKIENNSEKQFVATEDRSFEQQCRARLIDWYKIRCNKDLPLDNPQTINEKIQWLKLYDNVPLKTLLADKYLYRDWVSKNFGKRYLIPLLGVWDQFDDVDFNSLPNQFAIKTNHGSSWNIIVKDKSQLDMEDARKKFTRWLNTNFALAYGQELHYMNIRPRIIAEEYHPCQFEYQFWCFNGEAKFVVAIHEPHGINSKMTYDLDWNELDFVTSHPKMEKGVEKPAFLNEMIKITKKICKEFSFVRVDFLHDGQNLFIGEITFTPASGVCQWDPPETNKMLGDMLTLPAKKPLPKKKF